MTPKLLFIPILLPIVAGLLVLPMRKSQGKLQEAISLFATLANLFVAGFLFNKESVFSASWVGYGLEFSLRFYQFSAFIVLATAGFAFLVALYSCSFMRNHPRANQFYAYLLFSTAMVNGAVLANNLIVLLFFWEALLAALFGMIAIGRPGAFKTATKMFVIVGISDLFMLLGIAMTGWLAHQAGETHSLNMDAISKLNLPAVGLGAVAMVFLMIGAMAKGGAMPFHTWIPDAADDSPLPFMALMPASLEKLLGIYFLARISLDLYHLEPSSWLSYLMMTVGALTILLAVMMALVQKDYKRLLSYHAVSQVGYMILGIGTAVPIGIVGGLFHMINNALYKSGLFFTAGSVEKQTGTTKLEKLGGIARKMPVTFACFFVTAIAISGAPPLNGFYSKELVYDAALQRHVLFYIAALLGTFFTAASFLKLGHAAYFGTRGGACENVKEASLPILIPMLVIAAICVLFGLYNALPLEKLIQPVIADQLHGHSFAGLLPHKWILFALTLVALGGAVLNHAIGAKVNGGGLQALDHIRHAPALNGIYDKAENRLFDPYDQGLKLADYAAAIAWRVDRAIDWLYNVAAVSLAYAFSLRIRKLHTGSYSLYVVWSLIGIIAIMAFLIGKS